MPFLPTDITLARRLERTEARANAAFVEARARLNPSVGATWMDEGGTYCMFDGPESLITQTFGLGLFSTPTREQLEHIERFFDERGAETQHEVCPIADAALPGLLVERKYVPFEQSTVLRLSLDDTARSSRPVAGDISVRVIQPAEAELWATTSGEGWGDTPELADFVRGFGVISAASNGVTCFLAEMNGEPIAAGALAMYDGVAIFAGASTKRAFRGRGAQNALLATRLQHARKAGCSLAMMAAAPGSTSQVNAERQGFAIAYTRTKWRRPK